MFDFFGVPSTAGWPTSVVGDAWVKTVGRMQVETVAFWTRRMMASLELPQALGQCSTPEEVLAEHVRYWQVAQREYMQSLEKISTLMVSPPAASVAGAAARSRDYFVVSDNPVPVQREIRLPAEQSVRQEPLYKKSA